MPISHKYKLIFIHIPKTGGQSIEKSLGIYGADNNGSNELDLKLAYGYREKRKALQHCNVAELLGLNIITEEQKRDYFKFSFVRNPWDRFVSEYYWRIQLYSKEGRSFCNMTFPEFVESRTVKTYTEPDVTDDHYLPQSDYVYSPGGEMYIDYLGRFESLESDFYKVCDINHIPRMKLPRVDRTNHGHYSTYYSPKTKKQVEKYYMKDIDNFKYTFETK